MTGLRFLSYGVTDVGLVRRRNEDAFLDRPERGLWAVADGMGGHQAGDYASARIVAALDLPESEGAGLDARVAALSERLQSVDVELRARAAALCRHAVIASTVVVLLADAERYGVLWAGDSRCYLWRGDRLRRLTTDHSRVQELVAAGLLRSEDMAGHPEANIVTRAIGAGPVEIAVAEGRLSPDDRFLLCSDGLTNMVSDAEIAAAFAVGSPRNAAERLRDLVLARGAIDNVTIVVVIAAPTEQ